MVQNEYRVQRAGKVSPAVRNKGVSSKQSQKHEGASTYTVYNEFMLEKVRGKRGKYMAQKGKKGAAKHPILIRGLGDRD
jgi:hypothetical protein